MLHILYSSHPELPFMPGNLFPHIPRERTPVSPKQTLRRPQAQLRHQQPTFPDTLRSSSLGVLVTLKVASVPHLYNGRDKITPVL